MLLHFCLLFLLAPVSALAHGESPSLEAEVGGYLIDIGHEELRAGDDIEFDIDLFTADPIEYAAFASADIRITRSGALVKEGRVQNDAVHIPVFMVNFPEPGGYDMDVRYLDASDRLIVARTFRVEVPGTSAVMLRDGFVTAHYVLAGGLFALSFSIAGYAIWQRFGTKV